MALKRSKFLRTNFLIFFLGLQTFIVSQNEVIFLDSVFIKFFNSELMPVKSSALLKSKKPIIVVSTSHCSGCVKYFATGQKYYQFIFLMNSESLLEIQRITTFYNLKGKNIYFTTAKYIKDKKSTFCNGPTPVAIYKCKNDVRFVDYSYLNNMSKEFTLKHNQLINNLTGCKNQ